MAQVIAKAEIHRTINGQKQIIKPGTVFVPQSPAEEAMLRKSRSIRDPEKNETVAVPLDRAQAMADADRENETKAPASKTAAKPKTAKAAKTAKKDPLKTENEAGGTSQSGQTSGTTGDADSGSGAGDNGGNGNDGNDGNDGSGDGDDANLV